LRLAILSTGFERGVLLLGFEAGSVFPVAKERRGIHLIAELAARFPLGRWDRALHENALESTTPTRRRILQNRERASGLRARISRRARVINRWRKANTKIGVCVPKRNSFFFYDQLWSGHPGKKRGKPHILECGFVKPSGGSCWEKGTTDRVQKNW